MKGQKQEFSQEELKSFIHEMKSSKVPESTSLEHLIEDVLEAGATAPPVSEQEKRREEKPKRFRFPLLLSIAILSAFFLGSLFGFFWGKSQENARLSKELFFREKEVFSLLDEIRSQFMESKESKESANPERIDLLLEQKEPEKIAFKTII